MGFKRVGNHLTQEDLNQTFDAIERQNLLQLGRGVLDGCLISPVGVDGLSVQVSAGIIQAEMTKAVLADLDIPVQPNATSFVWRDESSRSLVTSSMSCPGGLFVCVGRVVTNDVAVVLCDGAGRMEPPRVQPDDARSFVFRGETLPKGPSHYSVAEQFIDGDLRLTSADRNVQVIDGGCELRRVIITENLHWGNWFRIVNASRHRLGTLQVLALYYGEKNLELLATIEPGSVALLQVKARIPNQTSLDSELSAEERKQKHKGDSYSCQWYLSG